MRLRLARPAASRCHGEPMPGGGRIMTTNITSRRRAMGSIRTAGAAAVLTAGLLLQQGCAARKPAPRPPSQPSLGASQLLRSELMRADPNARIGFVTQVLIDAQLVAVRDVPVEDFARGDTVNFLDGNGQPLTTGTVERVLNGAVHISYNA